MSHNEQDSADNWLVQLRLAAGFKTQQDFREALSLKGMTKHTATISLWEREPGGGIPVSITGSPEQLKILADVLNVDTLDILVIVGHLTQEQRNKMQVSDNDRLALQTLNNLELDADIVSTLEVLDTLPPILQEFTKNIFIEAVKRLKIFKDTSDEIFIPQVLDLLDQYVRGDDSLKILIEKLAQSD
ncbi:MAG: hypothetical protein WBC91_10550 [Phototrophicaceae bacterium]